MQDYREPENKTLFFLLSLLIHLLLLYIFFLFLSYQNSDKTVANERSEAQKDEQSAVSGQPLAQGNKPDSEQEKEIPKPTPQELAELKAQQSAFGAPVVFEDMPESLPTLATNLDTDGDGQESESEADDQPDSAAQSSFAKAPADRQAVLAQKAHAKEEIEEKLSSQNDAAQDASQGYLAQARKSTFQETLAALENKEAQEKQEQKPAAKKKRRKTPSKQSKNATALNEGNSQRSAGPTNKKFTFADLANGFMENLQSGGKDAINQRGNPNIRPGIEQLKQSSYRQKMAWNLQAAFKRAARRTTFLIPSPQFSRLECTFHIKKDGDLEKIDLLSSTGHQELDSYILATIKDAFPLPPIPEHWEKDMLVQTWVFRNIQPNESSYTVNF